jgi:hypothetical protein
MLNGEEEGIVTGREARAVERGSDPVEEEAETSRLPPSFPMAAGLRSG